MIRETFSFFINSFADKTPEWISAFAASVSAIGVVFVWRQLIATENIAQLEFEDALEKEYRDLVKGIPTKALLDSDLDVHEYQDSFDDFFLYFDLSNTQIVLRQQTRIGDNTWKNWCAGMRFNFSLPAFERAWSEVKMRTDDRSDELFSELRKLVNDKFETDPKYWKK